jgi:alpha-D-ribose 1-methylphosphonate 5-triphosphate diphosphatase PhnM
MKRTKLLAGLSSAIIASTFISNPAFAEKDRDGDSRRDHYKKAFEERHQMSQNMMSALKETMTILRDLNHKPTVAEKQRLSDMIEQMDVMMSRHDEMAKKRMKEHQKRGDGHHYKK